MAPFVLKFKGNKSFSPFSNLADGDALTRTWKVCTKVAAHLEQGQRLENLSWRLWHLHNLMVDSDADNNTKARREFKKLSRHTGERLDRDKNRDISDLQAPKFTSERLRQRAEEKERCRLASEKTAHAMRGRGIRGMQYTFALKPPTATATTTNVTANRPSKSANPSASSAGQRPRRATDAHKADAQPEQASTRPRSATTTQTADLAQNDLELPPHDPNDADVDTEHDEDFDMDAGMVTDADMLGLMDDGEGSLLRFETLFGGFGPDHLLVNPHAQSFTQPGLSYGEADAGGDDDRDVSVGRPTFEIQLEELLSGADDDNNTNKSGASTGEKRGRDETWSSTDTAANTDADVHSGKPRISRTNTNASVRSYNTSSMGVIGLNPDADSVPLTHAYAHSMFHDQASTTPLGTPTTTNNGGAGYQWGGSGSPPLMPAQSAPTSPAFALRPVRYGQQTDTFGTGAETFSPDTYADFGTGLNGGNGVPPLSLPVSYTTTTAGGHITGSSGGGHVSSSGNGGARRAGSGGSTGGGNGGGHHRAHSTGGLSGFKHPATININTANSGAPGSKGSTPTSSPTSRYDRTVSNNNGGAGGNGAPSATPPPTRGRSGSNALPLHGNTAPGGVKSECANCGANSTPLWRRGLNDELNCNACGLYCKLHKRPRPKTLRNSGGEGGSRNPGWHAPRNGDNAESMGDPAVSCYNCHTTATPLWRKDEEGRTLCNACGLYLKLHGERRPSSMKSDVIRKRSRHDARRPGTGGGSSSATPSASPGASRRASPTATSPTVNQDPSSSFSPAANEQHMPYYGPYDYSHASNSGMMGADEQNYPMSYAPSAALMFPQSVGYPGQVNAYSTQPYYGPFLPNMMDTSGGSPDDSGAGGGGHLSGGSHHGHHSGSNGMHMGSSHVGSSGSGQPPVHKKRRMSTADTLASSTSGSERSDGTPSFLDDLANPNVPDPSRASPSATFVPNNYQYTSFSPSLTYPNLPGAGDTNNNGMSYFHPPMVLPWLHSDMPLTNVGAKSEPVDEPMNSGELSMG